MSQLRKAFDKDAYRPYMEPHGPHTSSTVARTQAIASMVDDVVGTISGAMPSERARDLVEQNVFQVRRLLKREVETMFASIEQESATVHTCRPPHQDERVHAEPKRPPSAFFLFSSKAWSELPQGKNIAYLLTNSQPSGTKWELNAAKCMKMRLLN